MVDENKNLLTAEEEAYYTASQWELMWLKFKKHKLAIIGCTLIGIMLFIAIFAGFVAPYGAHTRKAINSYAPPMSIHFYDKEKGFSLRPFVYGLKLQRDRETLRKYFSEDKDKIYPIYFFIRGDKYKFWNLFETNIHLFGVKKRGWIYLFGTDKLGRDLFSRVVYATRTSMSVGLIGVALSFVLGSILGGVSGYYGGTIDMIIQRVIEFLLSIPTIPLWMGLAAAMPDDWSIIKVYFAITIILALRNWAYLARVVRGKLLEVREEDFVTAALLYGASEWRVIIRYLLPSFMSYLIVNLTLSIPTMILGETSLSFLGIGLRAPVVSWGVLLKACQNYRSVSLTPWLLIPVFFVIISVLAFNFIGDGLRDAADPYK